MMSHNLRILISCVFLLLSVNVFAGNDADANENTDDMTTPTMTKGAQVYQARCALCHGSVGMGEGLLPLSLKNYPSTNLLQPKYATDIKSVRDIIIWGGTKGDMSPLSPPWGNELTWTEIESVVMFTQSLRKDTEAALALLKTQTLELKPNLKIGRKLFNSRCSLCHGVHGTGDGKMAKIIKSPPPYDLTKSRMPDEYLMQIISGGGDEVGRSPQMPPWKEEFSVVQLKSVILYIKTLRE